ncbi:helix-turn-helix transcriptional regulator [Kosakonia sp. WA-90]|uniref:helix-turn-helix domain-containing protein n=1 Tax=Kosakonia sp. WA-90 TaxID=3153576 RepID=UPI00325F8BF8
MDTNWHKADVVAALHKKGTSLAALSRAMGLSSSTLANALERPWPKGEAIIAEAIGVTPDVIWPERYYKDGVLVDRGRLMRKRDGRQQP